MIYFYLMLPLATVLVLAVITRRVTPSLWAGAAIAALVATRGHILNAAIYLMKSALGETHIGLIGSGSPDHLLIAGFLLGLGVLMYLINQSGGLQAYTRWIAQRITKPRAIQQTSLGMSCLLFIDDYVSNLTVGAIMKPLVDTFGIARAKLAFLLDAMSGSLCVLVPATSWSAFICAQLASAGVSTNLADNPLIPQDPLQIYLYSIPFMLYPWASVITAFLVVYWGWSFGPMYTIEQEPRASSTPTSGNLAPEQALSGSPWYALTPIATFVLLYVGLTLAQGGFFTHFSVSQALLQANSFQTLFMAMGIVTCGTYIYFVYRTPAHTLSLKNGLYDSWTLMRGSLQILWAAWTFATIMREGLHLSDHLAHILSGSLSVAWIPLASYVVTLAITATTGSAWGAMGLMIPLIIPTYITLDPLATTIHLAVLVGAIIAGAVAGGHSSPLTDAMVMASTAAGCPHIEHVSTHMVYALPGMLSAAFGFTVLGFARLYGVPPMWYPVLAAASMLTLLMVLLYSCAHMKPSKHLLNSFWQ